MSDERETLRFVTQMADCDHIGHVNAGCYVRWLGEAAFSYFTFLGWDQRRLFDAGAAFVAVRADVQFKRELKGGDLVAMSSRLIELGKKALSFQHRLVRAGDDVLAMEARLDIVCLDVASRRGRDIPQDLHGLLAERIDLVAA
jgi:acyl-CoA thioester hydrolase